LKVRSAVSNAIAFMKSEEFGSFSKYIWAFTNGNLLSTTKT
jgi:DNA-3-methyladenine glycosylase I